MTTELDDLEARLRDMYAAVTATTVVDDPVMDTVPPAEPARRDGRRVALLVAAAVVVVAAIGWVVSRRGDAAPAGPMDGRPFAIPMWMPDDMGLDGTALIDDSGSLGGMQQTAPVLSARLKYDGANDRIVYISSADAEGLIAAPTGETVELADGTIAQWDGGVVPRLAWTLPTGQAVMVQSAGPEVAKDELIEIASSLWYVDRATWNAVTAKVGYVTDTFQRWRIPGDGSDVDLTVEGGLRGDEFYGLTLRTGGTGIGYQARPEECTAWGAWDGRTGAEQVVYMVPSDAIAVRAIGPDGETVEAPAAMAPGLPMFRWAVIAFPGASEQWVNGTDHSKGCTAVFP